MIFFYIASLTAHLIVKLLMRFFGMALALV